MSKTLNQDWLLNRSIKLLEFNDLLSFLTEYTKTEPGRKKALNLLPSQNLKEIEKNLDLLREMIALKNSGLTLPLSYFPDLRESFENAQKGVRLSVPELVEILKFVVQADKILEFCKALAKKFPIIAELGLSSPKFSQLKNALEKCFDEQGELKDSASQKLKELRSEHNSLRTQIQKNLEQILSSREYESIIQDKFYTEREGRLVIPVKSSAQSKLNGIVHDSSASGATVFIEPMEMVPLNNRLRIVEREIDAEINRILEELTEWVKKFGNELHIALDAQSELDLIQAKAELAERLNASIPALSPSPVLRLYQVSHPLLLLQGRKAIANDLILDQSTYGVIISGPNTGGKTVLLKTIGLLVLMVRAGMAIPAHPDSVLGFFPKVYVEIGDQQSLAEELSSYSAHLLNLIGILDSARAGAMVLIDEILGSTDPEEAGALAISILRQLKAQNCLSFITTHFSRLKAFGESEPGFINASFEFDPENLTPTYHLRLGVAGPSYGIDTAKKLGLKQELISEAKNLLSPEVKRMMELLARLDQKQTDLDQRLSKVWEKGKELEKWEQEIRVRDSQVLEKEQELKKGFHRQLEAEIRGFRMRLNQILEEIKSDSSREKISRSKQEISGLQKEFEEKYPIPELGEEISAEQWQVGDLAWITKLKAQAQVIEIDLKNEEATLAIGTIRLKEKLSGLRWLGKRERKISVISPVPSSSNTLDLRGKYAEEAEAILIDYLDRAIREAKPAVYIIHGHGTGVLKKMVRDYLSTSSYVESFRPGETWEGGDGITVAILAKKMD